MKISIVIPYWNGEEKIKKHLPKVLEFAKANNILEVIASDDASTDGTVDLLKSQFPQVVVVERKVNKGFSSNVNTGVSHSSSDFIFLLNSDAEPEKNTLKFALPHFNNPQVFSVGFNTGGSWANGYFKDGFFWHGQGRGEEAHQTLWASGGSSIFRKSIWDELGGFDTLFDPFYEEDVDLGYRATKRGYINIWEPKALVEHYKEVGVIEANFSKNKVQKIAERNHLIFIWKNITSPKLIAEHHKALAKMLVTHPKYWNTFLAAAKQLPEIMRKRKIEKKQAKITDEEIFSLFAQS
ncbi:glycosyltransferase family 2 protein [Candidatus Parcubacteria bacterium]|nr:MAG: glycosyltransferase family 2 protein [Candidatus Parcubacteria bacterium]